MLIKDILADSGLSFARGTIFSSAEKQQAKQYVLKSEKPMIVKPAFGTKRKGITYDVTSEKKFDRAWSRAITHTVDVLIEELHSSENVMSFVLVGGNCVAAVNRIPPYVIGNGRKTIEELITEKNCQRANHLYFRNKLIQIKKNIKAALKIQGLDLSSIPEKGRNVSLFSGAYSRYSIYADLQNVYDSIHPSFIEVVERVATLIHGLDVVTIEIAASDLHESAYAQEYIIYEIVEKPPLAAYHYPTQGKGVNVAREVVEYTIEKYERNSCAPNLHAALGELHSPLDSVSATRQYQSRNSGLYCASNKNKYSESEVIVGYPISKLIARELRALQHPVKWANSSLFIAKVNNHWIGFQESNSTNTSIAARSILTDKALTKKLLKEDGISVAEGAVFQANQQQEARQYALSLKGPAVVKPLDGRKGRGISVGVENAAMFDIAWENAFKFTKAGILIEEQFLNGIEARFLVLHGKCIAVSKRIPPVIIGNGCYTIKQLIEEKNKERLRNPHLFNRLIHLDEHRVEVIRNQGFYVDSIPSSGKEIFIDWKANFSTGADSVDITDSVHLSYKEIAIKTASIVTGLDIIGVDLLAHNFDSKADTKNYVVLEANNCPAIHVHIFPVYGKKRNVARQIADYTVRYLGVKKPE